MKRTRWIGALAALGIAVTAVAAPPAPPGAAADPVVSDVGIWYATWYSKLPTLASTALVGHGASSTNQFVADVNGDGKADAVTFESTGIWKAALSTGAAFAAPTTWRTGHGANSTEQYLADVDGDGRADAVVYFSTDVNGDGQPGDWYAALSTGSGFGTYTLWRSGAGASASSRYLADVTGEGRADLATFSVGAGTTTSGTWSVGLSTGTAFGALSTWKTGFGGNTTRQFLADTTGDGKADAAYFAAWDGSWYTTPSTGTAFGTAALWTTTHGIGSNRQLVADGNGDGFAEPYVYFTADVNGDGLAGDLYGREYDRALKAISPENIVMNTGFGAGATNIMQGNVTGDRYGWQTSVAFQAGTWSIQRYRAADRVSTNTWAGFPGKPAIRYLPLTLGSYQTYDSGDAAVIDEHLATLAGAEVDWLLMDETNGLNNVSGAILNRAHDVADRIVAHNAQPANRDLRYAFAIGRVQWTADPLTIEQEALQTWNEFANDPTIGGASNYYQVGGKPLLVVYAAPHIQNAWRSYTGDKSASNHFTVRFASTGQPGEYGWQLGPSGSPVDSEVMLTMPGWNNNVAGYTPVSRQNGLYYINQTWRHVLDAAVRPKIVVLNSFNEFAEETSVQIADTSNLVSPAEKWYNTDGVIDNAMYWNMTKDFVRQLKHPGDAFFSKAGFSSTQGANGWSYEQWTSSASTRTVAPLVWNSAQARWAGSATYALAGADWQHPDVGAETARVFTTTRSGSVSVSGVVSKTQSGGDGIAVRIMKNNVQVWPATGGAKVITAVDAKTFLFTVPVVSGDRIEFVTNARTTAGYDTTGWAATVTYQ